jgi:hypothetical protein
MNDERVGDRRTIQDRRQFLDLLIDSGHCVEHFGIIKECSFFECRGKLVNEIDETV